MESESTFHSKGQPSQALPGVCTKRTKGLSMPAIRDASERLSRSLFKQQTTHDPRLPEHNLRCTLNH